MNRWETDDPRGITIPWTDRNAVRYRGPVWKFATLPRARRESAAVNEQKIAQKTRRCFAVFLDQLPRRRTAKPVSWISPNIVENWSTNPCLQVRYASSPLLIRGNCARTERELNENFSLLVACFFARNFLRLTRELPPWDFVGINDYNTRYVPREKKGLNSQRVNLLR